MRGKVEPVKVAVPGFVWHDYIVCLCHLSVLNFILAPSQRLPTWFFFPFPFPVLAPSILDHCAGYDLGSVLCSDPSQLPHSAVAPAALSHLLLCVRLWDHSYHPLGLAQWRCWCIYCAGKLGRSPSIPDAAVVNSIDFSELVPNRFAWDFIYHITSILFLQKDSFLMWNQIWNKRRIKIHFPQDEH